MKTCEEMTASLLRRREVYRREKKRRSRIACCSVAGCLIVGIGVFSAFAGGGGTPTVAPGDTGVQESMTPQTGGAVIQGDICHHIITAQDYANGMESACYASPQAGECNYTIGLRQAMADYAYDPMTGFLVMIDLYDNGGIPYSEQLCRAEAERMNAELGTGLTVAALDSDRFTIVGMMTAAQMRAQEGREYGYFFWLTDDYPFALQSE